MGFDHSTCFFNPYRLVVAYFPSLFQASQKFCGFNKVPDASNIPRFKQEFLPKLTDVFSRLVDLTEPICQAIESSRTSMTIFDSSGIEAWVTKNNFKYANRIIKQLKAYAKSKGFDDFYGPSKAAFASMPSIQLPIPRSSSSISMGISVMPIK